MDLKQFLKIPFVFYKIIGLDILNHSSNVSFFSRVRQIFFYFNVCNLSVLALSQVQAIVQQPRHVIDGSLALPCLLYSSIFFGKILSVLVNRKSLLALMRDIDEFFPKTEQDRIEYEFAKHQKLQKRVASVLVAMSVWAILIYVTTALSQSIRDLFTFGKFSYQLPTLSWRSFDENSIGIYAATYFHQVYGVHICNTGMTATDLFQFNLLFLICMFIDYIAKGFRRLSKIRSSNKELRDLVEFHRKVLRMSTQANEIFGFSALLNISASSLNLCILAFRMTVDMKVEEIPSNFLLFMTQVLQIGLVCYLGARLMQSSTDVSDAAFYHFPYCYDPQQRSALIIILQRSRKPAVLNGPTISYISMETLQKAVSVSFKFFALLKSVRQEY